MSSAADPEIVGALSSFCSAITWTIGVSVYSRLSKVYPPFVINLTRAIFAFPLFILVIALTGTSWGGLTPGKALWLGASIVSSYALGDAIFLFSTRKLGVPAALAISSSFPIWSAIAAWIGLGQRLSASKVSGLIIVVTGVMIVILSGYWKQRKQTGDEGSKAYVWGVCLALMASLFWALNTYACNRGGDGITTYLSCATRMAWALLLCPLIGRMDPGSRSFPSFLSRSDFVKYSWLFAFEGFGGSFCFLYGMTHAPLAVAASLSSIAPVLSVPVAWFYFRQRVPMVQTMAAVMVVLGIWLLIRVPS